MVGLDAYDLATAHLAHTRCDDLLLMDRNYPSYRMLATLLKSERDFAIRCSAASFGVARRMLKGEGADSQIVTLTPCAGQMPMIRASGLPETLTVRFVRVLLNTGEVEVVVTGHEQECAAYVGLGLRKSVRAAIVLLLLYIAYVDAARGAVFEFCEYGRVHLARTHNYDVREAGIAELLKCVRKQGPALNQYERPVGFRVRRPQAF